MVWYETIRLAAMMVSFECQELYNHLRLKQPVERLVLDDKNCNPSKQQSVKHICLRPNQIYMDENERPAMDHGQCGAWWCWRVLLRRWSLFLLLRMGHHVIYHYDENKTKAFLSSCGIYRGDDQGTGRMRA